jgi:hypothetical protein
MFRGRQKEISLEYMYFRAVLSCSPAKAKNREDFKPSRPYIAKCTSNNTPIKDQQYIYSLSFLSIELCVFYIKVWDFVQTIEVTIN